MRKMRPWRWNTRCHIPALQRCSLPYARKVESLKIVTWNTSVPLDLLTPLLMAGESMLSHQQGSLCRTWPVSLSTTLALAMPPSLLKPLLTPRPLLWLCSRAWSLAVLGPAARILL